MLAPSLLITFVCIYLGVFVAVHKALTTSSWEDNLAVPLPCTNSVLAVNNFVNDNMTCKLFVPSNLLRTSKIENKFATAANANQLTKPLQDAEDE